MAADGEPRRGDAADAVPLFDPPLYVQRMDRVADVLRAARVRALLDVGCGEGRLLQFLRASDAFTRLAGVDVDLPSLRKAVAALQPLFMDFLVSRVEPLSVELYHGTVACVDAAFAPVEAVASVEVIEHLDPPVLDQFRRTVFGHYRPRVAVLTTVLRERPPAHLGPDSRAERAPKPNADFNVFFPHLAAEGRFRHPDHRFEWTRAEFEAWCHGIADEFGYDVSFDGIGMHPSGDTAPGPCSQMALFERRDGAPPTAPPPLLPAEPATGDPRDWPAGSAQAYVLQARIDYPHVTDRPGAARALVWAEVQRSASQQAFLRDQGRDGDADAAAASGPVVLADLVRAHARLSVLCAGDVDLLARWLGEPDERMPLAVVEGAVHALSSAGSGRGRHDDDDHDDDDDDDEPAEYEGEGTVEIAWGQPQADWI